MGNRNNREQWAGLERLRYIENAAFWRGAINRADLLETFGISSAQASGDFQSYHEVNPDALVYNLSKKRYEAAREMNLAYTHLTLEEAIRVFLSETTAGASNMPPTSFLAQNVANARVAMLHLPQRRATLEVERRVFMAVLAGKRIFVNYHSVHSSTARWRWIRPHAFGHDGQRWHARAWCEENKDFRDFVIARMSEAEWPLALDAADAEAPADADWEAYAQIRLKPASDLTPEQRQAVLLEYAMEAGSMEVTCRKAMEPYVRHFLQLPTKDSAQLRPRLEEC
jgi:hypothetical protein